MSNSTKQETFWEIDRRSTTENVIGATSIFIIAITSILGNSLVVAASMVNKTIRAQTGNMLITNLAIADLLCGILCMIPSGMSILADKWLFGSLGCNIHMAATFFLTSTSNVTLAAISYDRSVAVTKSLCYHLIMTSRKMKILTSYTWLQGVVFVVVPVSLRWVSYDYWEAVCGVCWSPSSYLSNTFIWIAAAAGFGVPSLLIVFFNAKILLAIRKLHSVDIRCEVKNTQDFLGHQVSRTVSCKLCNESAKKDLRSLYVLNAVYFVCFTPYAFARVGKTLGADYSVPHWLSLLATIMQFLSSATNPFIYAILRKDYRTAYSRLFKITANKCRINTT